jgi:hypothetical protein
MVEQDWTNRVADDNYRVVRAEDNYPISDMGII